MKTITISILVLTFALGLFISRQSHSQDQFGIPAESVPFKEFEQQGALMSVKIVPGDKETHFYFAGKEPGKNSGKTTISNISVTGKLQNGDEEKLVEFRKVADHFVTTTPLHGGGTLHLKAKLEDSEKSEEFHINMKRP
jgi:hypothetical protein